MSGLLYNSCHRKLIPNCFPLSMSKKIKANEERSDYLFVDGLMHFEKLAERKRK